ncbi:hypothetical protein BH24ACT19_BH24ACT19_13670 [soil metagenome]
MLEIETFLKGRFRIREQLTADEELTLYLATDEKPEESQNTRKSRAIAVVVAVMPAEKAPHPLLGIPWHRIKKAVEPLSRDRLGPKTRRRLYWAPGGEIDNMYSEPARKGNFPVEVRRAVLEADNFRCRR